MKCLIGQQHNRPLSRVSHDTDILITAKSSTLHLQPHSASKHNSVMYSWGGVQCIRIELITVYKWTNAFPIVSDVVFWECRVLSQCSQSGPASSGVQASVPKGEAGSDTLYHNVSIWSKYVCIIAYVLKKLLDYFCFHRHV